MPSPIKSTGYAATHCNAMQHSATHCNTLTHPSLVASSSHPHSNPKVRLLPKNKRKERTRKSDNIAIPRLRSSCDKLPPSSRSTATLQHTATHCNTLQHTATHCHTNHSSEFILQQVAISIRINCNTATHCNTLQHTATHCNTLHWNTLQHTATHCHTNHSSEFLLRQVAIPIQIQNLHSNLQFLLRQFPSHLYGVLRYMCHVTHVSNSGISY